jgi:hypothetical protein
VLALSRSWVELFMLALSRSFLGLKFCAFAFALPRSLIFRAPRIFAFFPRSLIFRARTFALLDFCAHNFVLVQNRQAEQNGETE